MNRREESRSTVRPGVRRGRRCLVLSAVALLLAACGRFTDTAVDPTPASGGSGGIEVSNPWLGDEGGEVTSETPPLIPWDNGPPVWNISFDLTQDVILEAKMGSTPEARAALGMPAECLVVKGGGEGPVFPAPWKTCALPVLAERGASEAALRFLDATGTTIFASAGTGPVKVAWATYWETEGMQDDSQFTYVFTPQGYYREPSNTPWRSLTDAVRAAYADGIYAELRALFPGNDLSEPYATWPLALGTEFGDPYAAPQADGDGWSIAVTKVVDEATSCWACQTEFAALFSLDFSADGTPESARYLGYCWFPEPHAWANENYDRTDALIRGTDALTERLPACPPKAAPEAPAIAN